MLQTFHAYNHFIFTVFLILGCLYFFLWMYGGGILIFWKIPGWLQPPVQSFCLAIWQRELQGPSLSLCVRTLTNRVPALLTVGTTLPSPRANYSFIFTLSELTPVMKLGWGFTNMGSDEMCIESWAALHIIGNHLIALKPLALIDIFIGFASQGFFSSCLHSSCHS